MGKANPFIRFSEPFENAGFEPKLSRESGFLNSLFNEFTDGDYIGQFFQSAINNIKAKIASINVSGGSFILKYPKPFPAIGGVQTLAFTIISPELLATNPGQKIEIELTLSGGNVTGSTFAFIQGPISKTSDYVPQIFGTEKAVKQALEVRSITGASFLPIVYNWTGSIAKSGLARLANWKLYNNAANRFPLPDAPFAPQRTWEFESLTQPEKYVSSLVESIIQYGFGSGLTVSDFSDFVDGFSANNQIPENWTKTFANNGTGLIEVGFYASDTLIAFRLVGKKQVDNTWLFQRFITKKGNASNSFITTYSADPLPYEFEETGLYFNRWYDFEFVCFNPECQNTPIPYGLPAKTGDILQFNVLHDSANLEGVTTCKVGLVNEDGIFVSQVGTAKKPLVFTFDLPLEFSPSCIVSQISLFEESITIDNKVPGFGQDFGTTTLDVLEFLNNFVSELTIGTASFVANGSGYTLTWIIANWTENFVPLASLGFEFTFVGPVWGNCFEGNLCQTTQFQATATIPNLTNGCYNFILYNSDSETSELYAISSKIKVDNQDCFSQMLEFGPASDGNLVEGFEYFGSWSQKIRIGIQSGAPIPQIEESTYRQSNGVYRRPSNKSDLKLSLQSNYLDKATQLAVYGATRHPVFILNGTALQVMGDVNVSHNKDFSTQDSYFELSQMDFEALIQGFQPENNTCLGC